MEAESQYFDLNIGEILEGWQPRHAVRELIANALDEQALTKTADVVIDKRGALWSIRDHGRGLHYKHLIQNENAEKLANASRVIGKFGVGLKDALATLHRRGVEVEIFSPHHDIAILERWKHGFDEVTTLHAVISPARDRHRVGTEIVLRGLDDDEMAGAKGFFLRFTGEQVLGQTPYGQILGRREGCPGRIYVNGLVIAEEPAFAFSYNVTSLTAAMSRALNRERANVGRTAFADRVKSMLLACREPAVAEILAREIGQLDRGTAQDEVKWTDVALHACRILNDAKKVVFVSSAELTTSRDMVDHARDDGFEIVTLPQNIREKLRGLRDEAGTPVRGLDVYTQNWVSSFQFNFIEEAHLSDAERAVFSRRDDIARAVGGWPVAVREVRVTTTMRPSQDGRSDALGLWEQADGLIVIRRDQLRSLADFAGTLLHEITHARTGASDISREFESALTDVIGRLAASALEFEVAVRSRVEASPKTTVTKKRRPEKASRKGSHAKPKTTRRHGAKKGNGSKRRSTMTRVRPENRR